MSSTAPRLMPITGEAVRCRLTYHAGVIYVVADAWQWGRHTIATGQEIQTMLIRGRIADYLAGVPPVVYDTTGGYP